MSRELDLLAKEFSKTPVTVMRTEVNLYQSNIQSATNIFLKKIDYLSKKEGESKIWMVAIVQHHS